MNQPAFDTVVRLDSDVVSNVRKLEMVRPGILERLVTMFDRNTSALLSQVANRLDEGDLDALRIGFHSLRGTAASMGALRLSQMALAAEKKCTSEVDTADLRALAWAMRTEYSTVRIELMTEAGLDPWAPV